MSRGGIALGLIALLLSAPGCKLFEREQAESRARDQPEPAEVEAEPEAPLPADKDEFLALLAPLPDDMEAVEIHYEVRGPAASGELVVRAKAGGYQRLDWTLDFAGEGEDGAASTSAGSIIRAPAWTWTAGAGEAGTLRVNDLDLEALAAAWLELDEADKRAAAETVHEWHRALAEQREAEPGERDTVLGVSCLITRVAAQSVCMWEEAFLILRYEGEAFSFEATRIDRDPKLAADAFALPPRAEQAERSEPERSVDVAAILEGLRSGDEAVMAATVSPSLRLPNRVLLEAPAAGDETGAAG